MKTLWNETSMKEAILALKTKKMGLRKAARSFDVPKDSKVLQVMLLKCVV